MTSSGSSRPGISVARAVSTLDPLSVDSDHEQSIFEFVEGAGKALRNGDYAGRRPLLRQLGPICALGGLGPFGITANCIAPGVIATGRIMATVIRGSSQSNRDRAELIALRRTEDCAKVVEFLATDLSDYVTGAVIPVSVSTRARGYNHYQRLSLPRIARTWRNGWRGHPSNYRSDTGTFSA
jgi:hypothetical protein